MKKISLTKGKYALVDDEDFDELSKYSWCSPGRYAERGTFKNGIHKGILMHRQIMGAKKGQEIDHIDRNRLNNQKSNLRFCTRSENVINAGMLKNNVSGVKGVHWSNWHKLWMAYIEKDKKRKYLGFFKHKQDAIKERELAELKYFLCQ